MTLEEIFKDDIHLLKNESVKKLIEYVGVQHKRSYDMYQEQSNKESRILHLFMYSDVMLINGKNSKETLKEIGKILNE